MLGWAIDLDGVIWRGAETVPGSPEAIARLREAGAPVAFVTNSAVRTPEQVAEKLASHGIPDAVDEVVTSAMAGASLVEAGERVLVVGGLGLLDAVEQRGAEIVETGPAEVVIVGLTSDFGYADMARAMTAIQGGARFVATNDDSTFPDADRLLPGAGSIVAAIATAAGVGPSIIAGKPHETIATFVRQRLGPEGVMVGDRPETDGLFARHLGYRFGLVLTGVITEADLPVEPEPELIEQDFAALVARVLDD